MAPPPMTLRVLVLTAAGASAFNDFLARLPALPALPTLPTGGVREKPVPLGDDLTISPMGFGTWAWGNKLLWGYDESNDAELQAAFDVAVAGGINFFDTGDSYGTGALEGRAEELLGQFRAESTDSRKRDLVYGTKLASYPWRLTGESMEKALLASMERMGRGGNTGSPPELMQLHWSTANYAPWQEGALRAGLVRCYNQGLVRAVGASNYGPKLLRSLHGDLADQGVPLASNQVQFSLLSLPPRTSGLLETSAELGVTPIAYSPLALGLLSGKYTGDLKLDMPKLPPGPRGLLFKQILPGVKPLLDEMRCVAEARQKTVAQVAINWCVCQGTVPIVGAKNAAQARENLGALSWRLTATELAALDAAAEAVPRGATQNIFQTK